ncbi:MAG TPA: hypothetical protein VH437_13190 [Terriglobales bacterium]|jgi:hypothetical protein
MEGLSRLVAESLVRHGFDAKLDPRRIQWSKWSRCESSFSVLLVPGKPGLFALAEEVIAPGETAATGGKRMLAVFQISETDDLGISLGRLFLPGGPFRERLEAGHCFVRYAVIEDDSQRRSAHEAFQKWMTSSSDAASGLGQSSEFVLKSPPFAGNASLPLAADGDPQTEISPPASIPSGF